MPICSASPATNESVMMPPARVKDCTDTACPSSATVMSGTVPTPPVVEFAKSPSSGLLSLMRRVSISVVF